MNGQFNPKQMIWPIMGILLGFLVAINPFYLPHITPAFGVCSWFVELTLVMLLGGSAIGAHVAVLLTGLFFAIPCFLWAAPLVRCLLMCFMGLPFAFAALTISRPPIASFRGRVAFLCEQLGNRPVVPRPRRFDFAACLQLLVATAIFSAAMFVVKLVAAHGYWLPVRWLAGGIAILAVAETATAGQKFWTALTSVKGPFFFQSPWLSASIGEFWTQRWNLPTSELFRKNCFVPLARYGIWLALISTFAASGLAHVGVAYMAITRWKIALACGVFFAMQPLLIFMERRMSVRRWPKTAARIWFLVSLATVSPLFVEPALQVIEPSWGGANDLLLPTLVMLGFVMLFCGGVSLASLASRPAISK